MSTMLIGVLVNTDLQYSLFMLQAWDLGPQHWHYPVKLHRIRRRGKKEATVGSAAESPMLATQAWLVSSIAK